MEQCTGCKGHFPPDKFDRHTRGCALYKKQKLAMRTAGLQALRKRKRATGDGHNDADRPSKRLNGTSASLSDAMDDSNILFDDYQLHDHQPHDDQPHDDQPHDTQPAHDAQPAQSDEQPPLPAPVPEEEGRRLRRRPQPVPDILPQNLAPLPEREETPTRTPEPEQDITQPQHVVSPKNTFEMWREYDYHPGSDPESLLDFSDRLAAKLKPPPPPDPLAHPAFATTTTSAAAKDRARLFKWHSEHTTNSTASLHALVDNVIRHPDFDREHFADNSWKREFKQLGASFGKADDWRKAEVTIEVPIPKKYRSLDENAGAASFPVKLDNFWYRPLCGVIRAIVEDSPESDDFVWNPYRVFVTNEDGKAERLHGELYWSSAWIEEHERVQRKVIPPERPGHGLPRALFALMFGSDATHLSQFGTEHAWPDYVMAGNKTKYTRGCPSSHSVHHIAQFTEVRCFALMLAAVLTRPTASRRGPRLHPQAHGRQGGEAGSLDVLQARGHACVVGDSTRRRVLGGVRVWNGSELSRWSQATHLSADFHLLSRLPREVSSAESTRAPTN